MKKLQLLSVAYSLILVAPIAQANVILNGGFETPDIGGRFVTYTTAPIGFDWAITGSGGVGVDVINSEWQGVSGIVNPDGIDQSVDIDFASTLSQSFATAPGQEYSLHFAYSHNFNAAQSTGHVDVTGVTNLLSATLIHDIPNTQSNMEWLSFDSLFIADSSTTTLTFTGEFSNGNLGFVIDDVMVNTIPIPAAVWLFGSGLIGLLGLARRKSLVSK